jgi:hypothetical protein
MNYNYFNIRRPRIVHLLTNGKISNPNSRPSEKQYSLNIKGKIHGIRNSIQSIKNCFKFKKHPRKLPSNEPPESKDVEENNREKELCEVAAKNKWYSCNASVVGRKHLRSGTPCQDASTAAIHPIPHLIVCDGRGSASLSHFGAENAVNSTADILYSAPMLFSQYLDHDNEDADIVLPFLIDTIIKTAAFQQNKLTKQHPQTSESDFEFTFLSAFVGKKRTLLLQVGDGAIVIDTGNETSLAFSPQSGEYAGQTSFVSFNKEIHIKHKTIPTEDIRGIAALTDGTAEKMVNLKDNTPGKIFTKLFDQTGNGALQNQDILKILTETQWEPKVQDDRSLAIISPHVGTSPDLTSDI